MPAHDWLTAGTGDVSCTRCGALITRPNDPRLTRPCLADDGDPGDHFPNHPPLSALPIPTTDQNGYAR